MRGHWQHCLLLPNKEINLSESVSEWNSFIACVRTFLLSTSCHRNAHFSLVGLIKVDLILSYLNWKQVGFAVHFKNVEKLEHLKGEYLLWVLVLLNASSFLFLPSTLLVVFPYALESFPSQCWFLWVFLREFHILSLGSSQSFLFLWNISCFLRWCSLGGWNICSGRKKVQNKENALHWTEMCLAWTSSLLIASFFT